MSHRAGNAGLSFLNALGWNFLLGLKPYGRLINYLISLRNDKHRNNIDTFCGPRGLVLDKIY